MASGEIPGSDARPLSFGLVEMIVAGGPSSEQTRLRKLVGPVVTSVSVPGCAG